MHLLKFLVQPGKASENWTTTVSRERGNIELMLNFNPGLEPKRAERFAKAYGVARRDAAVETGLPLEDFPAVPPFDIDEVKCRDFRLKVAKTFLQIQPTEHVEAG